MSLYLERRTVAIKPGCMDDAIRLCKAEIERTGNPSRLYTAVYGPFDVLLFDTTAESQAAIEKMWADWLARAETPQVLEQWHRLIAGGGMNELWMEQLGTPDVRAKYVERRTYTVLHGHIDEVLRLLKAEAERVHVTMAYVYTAVYGNSDIYLVDVHATDTQAVEKFWNDWVATPGVAAFYEQWSPHVVTGKRELWVEQ
jgi:hypothetical protein